MSLRPPPARIRLPWPQTLSLLGAYLGRRLGEQLKALGPISAYLVGFQTLVLGLPLNDSLGLVLGLALALVGLALFLEGLFLGLMPLGESLGLGLPSRMPLPLILAFGLVLGVGATLAEPSLAVLRMAGEGLAPWDVPVLYWLLNGGSSSLLMAIGVGVGLAVVLGLLRFWYGWGLKPLLFSLFGILLPLSVWVALDPRLAPVLGLAWDCGGITTGPVTVPLVLALGLGVSRSSGRGGSSTEGFGIVTLASAVPIITVLLWALWVAPGLPAPAAPERFFAPGQEAALAELFPDAADGRAWAARAGQAWPADPSAEAAGPSGPGLSVVPAAESAFGLTWARAGTHFALALQAIGPLTLLLLVPFLLLRLKVNFPDEIVLGTLLALAGLSLVSWGLETGLSPLGRQVGSNLPLAYSTRELPDQAQVWTGFDPAHLVTRVDEGGQLTRLFLRQEGLRTVYEPFDPNRFDPQARTYTFVPRLGPLFPAEARFWGWALVVVFAFFLGWSATLAEPALQAMGKTLETLSGGSFRQSQLVLAVALGVGLGLALGLAKILGNWPLEWLLLPPYLVLLLLSAFSSPEFLNVAWDSAGVTTGPVTVPLVLALGLGVSRELGLSGGFGLLALASAFPILTVLLWGLLAGRRKAA